MLYSIPVNLNIKIESNLVIVSYFSNVPKFIILNKLN